MNRLDAWAMAFGCMVGWGAFVMPGTTFLPVAGPLGTVIALVIGTGIMLVIGINFSFLMNRSPYSGGIYSYTKEAFGRDHAFISSWFLCLSYLTIVFLNGTALFVVLRTMFDEVAQKGFHYTISGNRIYAGEIIVSVCALAGIGLLFIFAGNLLQKIQTVLAFILMIGILVIGVFCLPYALRSGWFFTFGTRNVNSVYGIFSITVLAPWAFVGFDVLSFDTPSFKFGVEKSKGIMLSSIVVAGISYMIMAIVAISAMPGVYTSLAGYISDLNNLNGVDSVPTFYAARSIMGEGGLFLIGITALAGILTGIIGGYRATTKVLSVMSEDRILSEKFSKLSYSIFFIMTVSIILALFGRNTLSWFVDLTSFGAIVGFGYTSASAYKLAKMEGKKGIKITGALGVFISVLFIIVQLIPRLAAMESMCAAAFLLLSLWCLLGFVFYWQTINKGVLTQYSSMSVSGVVLFTMLLYSVLMWLAKLIASQEDASSIHRVLIRGGLTSMLIIFVGLTVMLYVQHLVRIKHEASEREKIRAVESNLAKSRFLFNMSHDIRTPMNAIMGYTELALKETSPETVNEYLTKIDESNHHMLSLLNDILEMSRIESGSLELEYAPADLNRVFKEVSNIFEQQMTGKQIDFQVHISNVQDPYVWCDVKNLKRVLVNLISNAYKFTDEGGMVSVSLWENGYAEDGYASYEIRVKDNGIGISKEFAEIMFNPFERERTSTDSGVEGTGLGLSITKSIVDLMGGTIDVLTSLGSGTEMIIRLKWRVADPSELSGKEGDKPANADQEPDFLNKRILLVEDIPVNLEIAKKILMRYGFMVETAENGQIAFNMVESSEPGYYDAILMDIQMPVMDGYTATEKIRKLPDPALSSIPIIAMTANAFKEDEQKAMDSGMQAHIAKPIDIDILISTLTDILEEKK